MNTIGNVFAPFGFHAYPTVKKYETTLTNPKTLTTKQINILEGASNHNFLVVLGYFPVGGSLVGFVRVVAAAAFLWQCHKGMIADPKPAVAFGMIARGIVEMTSCGVILIAIDTIVSVGRLIMYRCLTPAYS